MERTVRTGRAVVLAGGDSERFGDRDKALARVEGQPMLRRVADAVRAATGHSPCIAVADAERRDRYATVLDDAGFVLDAAEYQGPLAGFVAAVERVEAERVFACACDMPDLDPAAIAWLADRLAGVDAVVPVAEGIAQPLHAWYRRDAVLTAMGGHVDRLQSLLECLDVRQVPVATAPSAVPLASSLRNINTVGDLDDR